MEKMISVASGFQYSVNIGFDLNSDEKIKNFIPTKSSIKLLEEVLESTSSDSTNRARILIGAYGKGKSHIMLMILSILMHKDLRLFEKLLPKIDSDPKLSHLISNYYENSKKILPVIVTGSSTSLNQSFLLALERTLAENNLLGIMPDTNYKAAVSTITKWKNDYPETYNRFIQEIDIPIDDFLQKLNAFDSDTYVLFERIYPQLTSGSVFNPFLGFDVVDLYESVANSLTKLDFDGLYVVYDEFSKYLEANISSASNSDTKMLQDFAEKCNRSGQTQLHLTLISHKEISNYIDKLPQQKIDGWRGVSDRFSHVRLINNFSQTYEIISSVIKKDHSVWESFCLRNKDEFLALYHRYIKHQMFVDVAYDLDKIIKDCYPLHPVSTFILPRLSEKVAQNERTLFTFLSSTGVATLNDYLEKCKNDEFSLLTPDYIYDYFEPLFKKELYEGPVHSIYILSSTILKQLDENSLESKIVKTLSLIYILEQFERLKPTIEELIGIYSNSYTVNAIKKSLTKLIDNELVIYMKRSNDFLRLKKATGIDIRKKINDFIERQEGKVSVKNILNQSNFDNYIYPSRYNDEYEMTRYFTFEFLAENELDENTNWSNIIENHKSDGVIYGILPNQNTSILDLTDLIKKTSINQERIVFVLPKHYQEISRIVFEYNAVCALREQAANDPYLFDEYEVIYEDLVDIIRGFIDNYTHPEKYASIYIYNGEKQRIHRKASLTELLSVICDNEFSLTPIINNEAVNKNEITSVAVNSRNKIISGLLRRELEPNLGLIGSGQEISIMRSTLIRTGIWCEENGEAYLNLKPNNANITNMLSVIESFICEAKGNGRLSFDLLYNRLTHPNYHIGLRYGVIPIYLAVVMHKYKEQIAIYDRIGQVSINAGLLMQINSEPYNFFIEYLDWNSEKEDYVKRLNDLFSDYIISAEQADDSYEYIAKAIKRWYMALPKYSKEAKVHSNGVKIVKRQTEMIKLLKRNVNTYDLLFRQLPEVFNYQGEFTADVAEDIAITKEVYDGLIDELRDYLIDELKNIFASNKSSKVFKRTSMLSALKEWADSLDESVFNQLFPDGTNRFLELINSEISDEYLFIIRLAKLATDLRLEDWDNRTQSLFFETIKKYKCTAEEFHSAVIIETINNTNSYQISFSDSDGNNMTKRFDKVDVSARGKLLYNQITAAIDSMGHSISEQEKRQILMEVLKNLC